MKVIKHSATKMNSKSIRHESGSWFLLLVFPAIADSTLLRIL